MTRHTSRCAKADIHHTLFGILVLSYLSFSGLWIGRDEIENTVLAFADMEYDPSRVVGCS